MNSKKTLYDRILVLGSGGMLAGYILEVLDGVSGVGGVDRDQLDATDKDALRVYLENYFKDAKQGILVNCVAYNNVDEAENKPGAALALNFQLPADLVEICADLSVAIIHYSTGYVFDGQDEAYKEDAKIRPMSVYAKSKAEGEQIICAYTKGYVIRTNLLYGNRGTSELSKRSFVDAFLHAGNDVQAISDEYNSSCYAKDLAGWTVDNFISTIALPGIYHGVNEGSATWLELAEEIFKHKPGVSVTAISRKGFNRLAHRPQHVVLLNTKLPKLRDWKNALFDFLNSK